MHNFPDKFIEGIAGIAFAMFAFLSRRTFNTYDRRIQKTEEKQDKILCSLNSLEKQVVRVATQLENLADRQHYRMPINDQ
jgi:hypothetical protein